MEVTRGPLASGDLIAQRRFAYAKAAAGDGDFRAAAEVLEQALERAPDWAAAWFAPMSASRAAAPCASAGSK